MTQSEIEIDFCNIGEQKFRAKQVYRWLSAGAEDFDQMTDLSNEFRRKLKEKYYISVAIIEKKQVSKYDDTSKYLLKLHDGELVECVLMSYHHGYSLCISTQVGCKMGCTFCATGKSGFGRDLLPSEMIAQIETVEKDIGRKISNLVLMGMGEPLDNYDNVLKFLKLISDSDGRNLGMRHISLSTCGIVPKIYQLADEGLQLTLSISLHAPNDEIRSKTMPINKVYNIESLLKACRYYSEKTKRRISFEYAMIKNLNDTQECAQELSKKLRGIISHVNLIPVNDVNGAGFTKSENMEKFQHILIKNNITATVRRTLGNDIDAACGQLRRRHLVQEGEDREDIL